jgi:hypothetical protein
MLSCGFVGCLRLFSLGHNQAHRGVSRQFLRQEAQQKRVELTPLRGLRAQSRFFQIQLTLDLVH